MDQLTTKITATLALTLLASSTAAQQHPAIERCMQTDSDKDRIACLEATILAISEGREPPAEPVPTLPGVTADNVLEVAAAEAAALDIDDQANIGQDQVDARTETRDERQARLSEARGLRVAEFEYVGYRKLQVRLENGQIWRQIKGDVQEIRVSTERNPTVDITESSLGGYKLRLNGIKRTIRVQRIR